jgi:hypothetical protein
VAPPASHNTFYQDKQFWLKLTQPILLLHRYLLILLLLPYFFFTYKQLTAWIWTPSTSYLSNTNVETCTVTMADLERAACRKHMATKG